MPEAFVVAVTRLFPPNVALAPLPGAVNVTTTPASGFADASVTFACSGAPLGATCSVSPQTVTLNGTGIANVTVKVATTARSQTLPENRKLLPPGGNPMGLMLLAALALLAALGAWTLAGGRMLAGSAIRLRAATLAAALLVAMVLTWASCGGGSVSQVATNANSTPSGTYSLTVTGTYSATGSAAQITHNSTLTLTVH